MKAKEFLKEVNESFNELLAQKEKLSSELEALTNQNDLNLISAKEKELQSLIGQIQVILNM